MKTSFQLLLWTTFLSLGFFSCNNPRQASEGEEIIETPTASEQLDSSYQLVWSDEFEEDSLNTNNWNYQVLPAGRFNGEWQAYTDSEQNTYIEDGALVIKANYEGGAHGMGKYTSARLNTAQKQSWKYGKIAARIKLPYSEGLWPAFWMLGSNINENGGDTPWPQSGEIDILELYGLHDDGVVEANIHYADAEDKHAMMGAKAYKLKKGKFADDFHVFELVWNAEKLTWFVDGNEYASASITGADKTEFHQEFFLLLNIAIKEANAEGSTFPQYMYVDWVRVYQK